MRSFSDGIGILLTALALQAAPVPGSSPHEKIRAVVATFNEAVADADARLLCEAVIAPSTRQGASIRECSKPIHRAMVRNPEDWKPLANLRRIEVHASSAEAQARQGGRDIPLTFVREQHAWWLQVFN